MFVVTSIFICSTFGASTLLTATTAAVAAAAAYGYVRCADVAEEALAAIKAVDKLEYLLTIR